MGRFIENRFEAEFFIDQPVDAVWDSFEKQNETQPVWLTAWPRLDGDSTGEVTEVDKPHRIRAYKHSEPCKGTEIAITLESADNGTRVMVVQSGFPAWVKAALESFTIGGNQIIADLVLFLERGVEISRHSMPWAFAGMTTEEVATGLQISSTMPGTFAEKAGLQSGDLLLTVAGAPVFTQQGLQAMMRVFKTGDQLEAVWVRDRDLQRGSAIL